MDENAEPGTLVTFTEHYSTKVRDEDIGKAGVFALKLANNNGTYEINPTVAERTANFIITVRDNSFIDYEQYKSLRFMVRISTQPRAVKTADDNNNNSNAYYVDNRPRGGTGYESFGERARHHFSQRRQRQSSGIRCSDLSSYHLGKCHRWNASYSSTDEEHLSL